ncbi:hypothetical protein ACFODL_11365 [Phenylobacterium terrae]|uniref:Uncharacterized protein n=1 Tax=Phenylobacterium terrae TaxID=2665495 RepID=A0ABW4MYI7_9CAUL
MKRLLLLVAAAVLFATSAEARDYRAPRTSFGQPDLQGIWTNTSTTFLQRPPNLKALELTEDEAAQQEARFLEFLANALGEELRDIDALPPVVKAVPNSDFLEMDLRLARIGGKPRSSWIVDPPDGRLPLTEAARKANAEAGRRVMGAFEGPEVRPPEERCLTAIGSPEGPPMLNAGFNGHYQIVQTPDHVAIHVEMNHDVRIVRLKDRSHPPPEVSVWMGDSVGWWEGDTLVVETTNLNPKARVNSMGGGFGYTPTTRIVERFTRTAKDQILYEFAVEDPATFTRPWRAQMPWRPAKGPIYEYACHEGNYSLANILAGARVQEAAGGTETAQSAAKAPVP